jgi:exonuclease SbcD
MAKEPELVRSADGERRVDASFPSGRYTFSLRSGAADLLADLGYRPGDAVPWDLFRALAIVGDAWLPNVNDDVADDLAVPDTPTWLDAEEARTVADYLRSQRVGAADRERLADVFDDSPLGDYLSAGELESKSEWVERTAALVTQADDSATADQVADDTANDAGRSKTRLLHVGKATLGRQNMGRAVRAGDYLDAFGQAVDVAVERGVDAVVQTGRLFQSGSPDRETVAGLQDHLARLRAESIPFYLVCGPKEIELRSTVLNSLETSGLVRPIDGRAVEVGEGVTLVGVGADTGLQAVESAVGDGSADETLLVACGDADLSSPGALRESLDDRLPARQVAIVAGERTDPVRDGRGGVPLLDPGSIEHVLSESTIDEDPPDRGVDEYSIAGGDLAVMRHALDTRPYRTFEFEVDESTTLDSIESSVSGSDLEGSAVLARLEGGGPGARDPSRAAVQSLLAERAFCARVYDDRSVPEETEEVDSAAADEDGGVSPEATDEAGGVNPEVADETGGDPDRLAAAVSELADLAAELETLDSGAAAEMETAALADSYAVLSKAKSEVEDVRRAARDELSDRVEPNETVVGEVGAVAGRRRQRRSIRDSETVEAVLREHDVPVERVTTETVDSEKVEAVLDEADGIAEEDVFEFSESEYVRRTEFDPDGFEVDATSGGGESGNETAGGDESGSDVEGEPHKVYLGDGAPIGGWTPVERSVVEDEIVPLVEENRGGEGETISVNFSSGVSVSGWKQVDASVVRERIVPLVEEHRVS